MPTLPALFAPDSITKIDFLPSEGVVEPYRRYGEPGTWWNCERKDTCTGCFTAITMIVDNLLANGPSDGTWSVEVTPITTQNGAAAADWMAPATISYTTTGPEADSDVVLGLIAAANTSANLLTQQDVDNWNRFRSYVVLSVGGTAETLRATSVQSGMTFAITVTPVAPSTVTPNTVASPDQSTLKVGGYVAIDRTQGANGYNDFGQPFLVEISASTPAADIVGPVYLGADTEPVNPGFKWREYDEGSAVAIVSYGVPLAYGETAIGAASIDTPVYIRHTADGDYFPGMVTDAAGAAAGATANVWTMTPVVANDTLYQLEITYGLEVVVLEYLSDGTAADTEITAGILAELDKRNGAGQPLEGITGVDGATLVLTGPADGTSFTPASIGVGDMGEVETTAGVTTHILFERDKFKAQSPRVGPVPVAVPHP